MILIFSFSYSGYKDKQIEKKINDKFHQEVAKLPGVSIRHFLLWEGDSIASIEIKDMGVVDFWYGKDGAPRITGIGEYHTDYVCFYAPGKKDEMSYAYDMPLDLSGDSKYKKWFPFSVNTLSDLVEKYDLITDTLKTFPKYELRTAFEYNWMERKPIDNPDMNYVLKTNHRGQEVWCDLRQ